MSSISASKHNPSLTEHTTRMVYRGGAGLYGDDFARDSCGGGGGFRHPLGIPKLQLPHAHRDMQANAAFRVINSWKLNCH